MQNRRKLIYIYGLGRSGSTLIGQIIGQAEGARYLGEFVRFTAIDDLSRTKYKGAVDVRSLPCECGLPTMKCKDNALNRYLKNRPLHLMHKWFSLSGLKWPDNAATNDYFLSVKSILDTYPELTLVDTSKNSKLFFFLSKSPVFADYDVQGVFVYRGLKKVWNSWRTDKEYLKKKPATAILANMIGGLLWSTFVFLMRGGKDHFINFDQFRLSPSTQINVLNKKLGVSVKLRDRSIKIRSVNHGVAGNPSKLDSGKEIIIR